MYNISNELDQGLVRVHFQFRVYTKGRRGGLDSPDEAVGAVVLLMIGQSAGTHKHHNIIISTNLIILHHMIMNGPCQREEHTALGDKSYREIIIPPIGLPAYFYLAAMTSPQSAHPARLLGQCRTSWRPINSRRSSNPQPCTK